MVDVDTQTDEVDNVMEKVYKNKDYVRRAKLKYEKKKYAEDPEYRAKKLEIIKQCHNKNLEKYREYSRLYMREYRAKKKLEKQQQTDLITTNMANVANVVNVDVVCDKVDTNTTIAIENLHIN